MERASVRSLAHVAERSDVSLDYWGATALILWAVAVLSFLFLWHRLCKVNASWRDIPDDPPVHVRLVRDRGETG